MAVITGTGNDDTIVGFFVSEDVTGGAPTPLADTIDGLGGADVLDGAGGADLLVGGEGDDVLFGGGGADTLAGGLGADTFEAGRTYLPGQPYSSLAAMTVITDFAPSEGDVFSFGAEAVAGPDLDWLVNAGTLAAQAALVAGLVLPQVNGAGSLRQFFWIPDLAGGAGWGVVDLDDDLVLDAEDLVVRVVFADGTSAAVFDPAWADPFEFARIGTAAADSLTAAVGGEVLVGLDGADSLQGQAGDDQLDGSAGNDTLDGGVGEDFLWGGPGADRVEGGAGDDYIQGDDFGATLGGADTLLGGDGHDQIAGEIGADSLLGGAGDDTLSGELFLPAGALAGADTLAGGAGNDSLSGGAAFDIAIYAGNRADYAIAHAGPGRFTVVDLRFGAPDGADTLDNVEWLRFADTVIGSGPFMSGTGSFGADSLSGDEGANLIPGFDGADSLSGFGGADTLIGGPGNDSLAGGDGADRLIGDIGNDTLNGEAGFDLADYSGATGPVFVAVGYSAVSGYASTVSGALGTDQLVSVEQLMGGVHNDTLVAQSALPGWLTFLIGGGGQDSLAGPASVSAAVVAYYGNEAFGVAVDLEAGSARDGLGFTDTLANLIHVHGSAEADTLRGAARNELFVGAGGNDIIDGRGGAGDYAVYADAPAGVLVDLGEGTAEDGQGGTDTLIGIERVMGSVFDDTLRGDDANNIFSALAGANTIDGGLGFDRVAYDFWQYRGVAPLRAVHVDLLANEVANPYGATDRIASIERATGTAFADIFTGDAGPNRFNGRGGNDTLSGGPSGDVAEYFNAATGVVVNLDAGTASDGENGADSLTGIEHVEGSGFADTITGYAGGDFSVSMLAGGAGNDLLRAPRTAEQLQAVRAFIGTWLFPTASAVVDLEQAVVGVPGQGADTIENLNAAFVYGTGNHSLRGTARDNLFETGAGADTLDGRGGFDIADFSEDLAPGRTGVVVDLAAGNATDSWGSADRLLSIEGAIGFYGADSLLGGAGNELFLPNAGADTVNGGDGVDEVAYAGGAGPSTGRVTIGAGNAFQAAQGVFVDLEAGAATDPAGHADILIGIENAAGAGLGDTLRGDALANRLDGRHGADSLAGGAGADTLIGGRGDDSLDGGAGSDEAVFAGNQVHFALTLLPGGRLAVVDLRDGAPEGADTLSGIEWLRFEEGLLATGLGPTEGGDTLAGSEGADSIDALGGNDSVVGQGGADSLVGGSGADTLLGGADNDTLDGGAGADSLSGGLGDDLFLLDAAGDRASDSANAGADTVRASVDVVLANNIEVLELVGAALSGTGNNQANRLLGNAGANTLYGLGGADTMEGGAGDDTYRADGLDTVVEQPGGGLDRVLSGNSFSIETSGEVEQLLLVGPNPANGTGNALANLLIGNTQANRLEGLGSADTLNGGLGNDTLRGGEGADSLFGGGGLDRLEGGAGDDLYRVTELGVLVIEGAGAGTDLVTATVSFTLGNHVENLTLSGGGTIDGAGNGLANVILGNGVANLLDGGAGNDSLSGGNGNDTLIGGAGADTLSGGNGLDVYRYAAATQGADSIADYVVVQDTIEVSAAGFGGGLVAGMDLDVPARFVANTTGLADAAAGTGQFVYETDALVLWFDADGIGPVQARALLGFAAAPAGFDGGEIVVIA